MRRNQVIAIAITALACIATGVLIVGRKATPVPPMPPHEEADGIPVTATLWPEHAPPARLPDLSKVDRRLVEPPGLTKPLYCLLVFGPQAATRVWLVLDGEKFYVDRNGDGDLTDPEEAF
jgi:hypothetical protein